MSKENQVFLNGKIKTWGVYVKDGAAYFTAECEMETSRGKQTETAFISLVKKDGTINTHQRESLMTALGWDGQSLKTLAAKDAGWDKLDLRFTMERAEDRDKWSVSWINRRSVPTANAAMMDEVEKKWKYLLGANEEETPF